MAILDEFDAGIVDAYPAALLWALACAVEQRLGASGSMRRCRSGTALDLNGINKLQVFSHLLGTYPRPFKF